MPDEISYFYPAFSFITSLFFRFKLHFQLKIQIQQIQEQHSRQIRNLQRIHNQELEAKDKEISRLSTLLEKVKVVPEGYNGAGMNYDGCNRRDVNGLPMQGEDAVIGTVSPDFRLGFNTNIELYKFRISAVFDWKQGGQMYSGTAGEMNYYGVSKLSGDMRNTEFIVENSVKETGKDADGNSIYAPNDIKVTDAQAYFTRRRIQKIY